MDELTGRRRVMVCCIICEAEGHLFWGQGGQRGEGEDEVMRRLDTVVGLGGNSGGGTHASKLNWGGVSPSSS